MRMMSTMKYSLYGASYKVVTAVRVILQQKAVTPVSELEETKLARSTNRACSDFPDTTVLSKTAKEGYM